MAVAGMVAAVGDDDDGKQFVRRPLPNNGLTSFTVAILPRCRLWGATYWYSGDSSAIPYIVGLVHACPALIVLDNTVR